MHQLIPIEKIRWSKFKNRICNVLVDGVLQTVSVVYYEDEVDFIMMGDTRTVKATHILNVNNKYETLKY